MDALYTKTAKGYDEVETKAGGLPPVLRRVLIFVNGKRNIDELKTLPRVDNLQQALLQLEQDGYIYRASSTNRTPTPSPAAAVASPETVPATVPVSDGEFRPLPPTNSPLHIQQVRNFMSNTLSVFVGSFGSSALLGRLQNAQTHADFRSLFSEWYTAITGSRDGRREADKLRAELLKLI
ncbi:hypothetical protein [Thiothrix fructosivorans]|uniref:Uncharacterized protein n=1 Tax=Thiothrix fructosivorans TaxID=111770 RepID=A0A8B0SML7_9GAMM|nr:hypothetical protein [Thiothrix fructosivorans]MBO0612777.1 hypothetical protein [Thiothrix fructosivorans]QTX11760.1 hypothetical protein J1836_005290 [Thiothrix fructosivorans]